MLLRYEALKEVQKWARPRDTNSHGENNLDTTPAAKTGVKFFSGAKVSLLFWLGSFLCLLFPFRVRVFFFEFVFSFLHLFSILRLHFPFCSCVLRPPYLPPLWGYFSQFNPDYFLKCFHFLLSTNVFFIKAKITNINTDE